MSWKNLIFSCLIILVLVGGFFFLNHYQPSLDLEQELLDYIEKQIQIELTIDSLKIWPLNRVVLGGVTFQTEDFKLTASSVVIYFNLFDLLFKDKTREGLSSITLEQPELELHKSIEELAGDHGSGLPPGIPELPGVRIYFDRGQVRLDQGQDRLQLVDVEGLLETGENQGLDLEFTSALRVDSLNYKGLDIENRKLPGVSGLLKYRAGEWQLKLKAGEVDLAFLNDLPLAEIETGRAPLTLNKVGGKGRLLVSLSGNGEELHNYRGRFQLERGQAVVSLGQFVNSVPLTGASGDFTLSSQSEQLVVNTLDFDFAGNPYHLEGQLYRQQGELTVRGHLSSSALELEETGIDLDSLLAEAPEDFWPRGTADFDLKVAGRLSNPEVELDISLPGVDIQGYSLTDLEASLSYTENLLRVDDLKLHLDRGGSLTASGIYRPESRDYSFQIQGQALELATQAGPLAEQLDQPLLKEAEGQLKFSLALVGKGFQMEDTSIIGELSVPELRLGSRRLEKLKSNFWMTGDHLYLEQFEFELEQGWLAAAGEIGLEDRDLELNLQGEGLRVSTVTDLLGEQGLEYDLPDIKGRASFQGELGQTLDNPRLELSLELAEASIQGNNFQGFQALIVYNDRLLQIDSLTADSENFQLSGSGLLDLQGEAPEVQGDLSLSNLEYDYLDRFVEPRLPLEGSLDLDLEIAGNPATPRIEGAISSFETTIDLPRRSFEVNTFKLVFEWYSEQLLAIKHLELTRDQTRLTASGGIEGKQLDLEVGLDNLNLYELGLVPHLTGDLDLEARIRGTFEEPEVSGSLMASGLFYRDYSLDRLEGDFRYSSGKLELPGALWSLNQGQYRLSGAIRQLQGQPELDLRLTAEQSQLEDFFRFVDARPADLPFDLDYQLAGGVRLLGPVASPETRIDLKLINQENKGNLVEFKGKMAEQLEVNITGKDFAIKEFMGDNLPSEIEGKASFSGTLAGTVSNPRLELETTVEDVEINSHQLKDIRGQLRYYHENGLLTVKQDLTLPDQRALRLAGSYRFNPGRIQELQLNADRFPVEILAGAAPGLKELEGHIDGQAGLTGTLDNPHLEGKLSFELDTMDFGLHRRLNSLNGELIMEDRKIVLNDTGGYYGGKAFRLTGKIRPFSREEFWDLGFDGEELAFNRGDYQGRLDARLRMTGPLFQPLFSGELKAHQFQVSPPFEWPEGEDGESRFKPRLDLTVVPGKEVFIRDENLEIPMEEGSLRLLLADDNFDIEGTLSTGRGNFSYYNTRFLIERARAEFQRFEDNIPEIQGEAWTVVSGTRINLNVTGPADNMVLTLSSTPEMSEDEILNLLASRGGLGSLIFGDSEGMGSVIKQEARRFLQRIFQVDIIGGLETGFKKALELDRVEIDTYDLGREEEITIHLGKDLTDRLSLDFSTTFGDEDGEQELSFRYFLDEKTYLEGGWYGEDDFRMSIETNIPF